MITITVIRRYSWFLYNRLLSSESLHFVIFFFNNFNRNCRRVPNLKSYLNVVRAWNIYALSCSYLLLSLRHFHYHFEQLWILLRYFYSLLSEDNTRHRSWEIITPLLRGIFQGDNRSATRSNVPNISMPPLIIIAYSVLHITISASRIFDSRMRMNMQMQMNGAKNSRLIAAILYEFEFKLRFHLEFRLIFRKYNTNVNTRF